MINTFRVGELTIQGRNMRAVGWAAAVAAIYIILTCHEAGAAQTELRLRVVIVNCDDLGFAPEKAQMELCRDLLNARARQRRNAVETTAQGGARPDTAWPQTTLLMDKWGLRVYTRRDLQRILHRNIKRMQQRRAAR